MTRLKFISRILQAIFYIVAGANHFLNPEFYLPMMPSILPAPDFLHKLAGALEILGGLGLLIPRYQTKACYLLIALLIAVFPANIYVALQDGTPMGISPLVAWIRLPFQFLFIAWVWWSTSSKRTK